MSERNVFSDLCASFAQVFDYPSANPAPVARRCASLLADPEAASMMETFAEYCDGNSVERLQEVYTRTFDLQPSCSPYIGYHLFGDGYRRGDFMARLKERYEEMGMASGGELPDHLTLVLRFLAVSNAADETADLVRYCLLPSLDKMMGPLVKRSNPYAKAFQALALSMRRPLLAERSSPEVLAK
jgi:nitrate reductase delta subunit